MNKIILILTLILWTQNVFALAVIRDSEIESTLTNYVRQIFKAVNLPPENAEIILINDPSINAFVAGGQTIFVHTGLITSAKSADDLIFVLSHETGHIVGGHITRGMAAMEKAQTTALISTLMGGLLAVVSGRPDAGIAVMLGSQSSALGTFAGYRQTEESAADRTAVDVVEKLGYSMQGFTNVMRQIQAQERLNSDENQNYLRTHPLTEDRRQNLQRFVENAKPVHQDKNFTRIKAKLVGFLWTPKQVRQKYAGPSSDDIYARAIADYRDHKTDNALSTLEKLIQDEPNNAYLYELKGQFEFETGRLDSAVQDYEKAVQLLPEAALIRISLAQSLLEREKSGDAENALAHLTHAALYEADSPLVWQLAAKAYDRLQKPAFADCAMAEFYLTSGKKSQAFKMAEKALKKLPESSVCATRMNDILSQKEN
ncbi:MAG: M48 family metalloprotease [Alphaproteobacteria bacterium]